MEYTLSDVIISEVKPKGGTMVDEVLPLEEVSFNYAKIECLAISRAAASSRIIMHELDIKTVAAGTIKQAPAGPLTLICPFSIGIESMHAW